MKLTTTALVVERPTPSAPPSVFIPSKHATMQTITPKKKLFMSPVNTSLYYSGCHVFFMYSECEMPSLQTPIR